MEPKEKQALIEAANKILESERCVFEGYGACNGSIIHAHTVSKCLGLTELVEDGHVYSYDLKPSFIEKERGMAKIGIKRVSTFNFACAKHDNDLFKEIESGSLIISENIARLFILRSMAQEIYEGGNHKEFAKLLPIMQTQAIDLGAKAKERDNQYYFEKAKKEDMRTKYCCLNYSYALPFLATTAYSPFLSVNGGVLFESGHTENIAPLIVINCFNFEQKGKIIFSWPEECSAICEKFMKDFLLTEPLTDFILNFLFVSTQNLILRVSFFDELPQQTKDALIGTLHFNMDPRHPYQSQTPDFVFGLENFSSCDTNVGSIKLLNFDSI